MRIDYVSALAVLAVMTTMAHPVAWTFVGGAVVALLFVVLAVAYWRMLRGD